MPSEFHHKNMTRIAVDGAKISGCGELIERYCLYPDICHRFHEEVSPYLYIRNGVEFHYIPHTPVEEFYRYWQYNAERGLEMISTRENENFTCSEAAFRFYIEKSVAALRAGKSEDAWKYMGCLLHFLEDSAFGVHAFEGTDGSDIYVLDRLSGKNVAKYLCSIPLSEELLSLTVTPEIFAANAEEAVYLLYRRCAKAAGVSRQALFDMALEYLTGVSTRSIKENEKIMFLSAVQLACDTLATVVAIAGNNAPELKSRQLSDFEPFHYPIGGGGSFGLRKFDLAANTITFGVNVEARLLYVIPENCYRNFSMTVSGNGTSSVFIDLINHGKTVQTVQIENDQPLTLSLQNPGGVFGFVSYPGKVKGELIFSDGLFTV